MKISVIGSIMRDEIRSAEGGVSESLGGILYSVLPIAALTRQTDRVVPVSFVSREHLDSLRTGLLGGASHIATSSLQISDTGTDENILCYNQSGQREEHMTIRTPPLEMPHLEIAVDSKAVLFNFVNGSEVSIEVLRAFRRATRAHIHADIHNLVRTIDEKGRLIPRGLPDWKDWFKELDTVQADESEVGLLLGKKPGTLEEAARSALELLSVPNLRVACVTMESLGTAIAHRLAPAGVPHVVELPSLEAAPVVDATGCGDCFAAGFVVGMLRYRNPVKAGIMATALSGLNARGSGLREVETATHRLDETMRKTCRDLFIRADGGWCGEPVSN